MKARTGDGGGVVWCEQNECSPPSPELFRQNEYSGEERVCGTQWNGFWSFLESSYLRTCLQLLTLSLAITETTKQKNGLSEWSQNAKVINFSQRSTQLLLSHQPQYLHNICHSYLRQPTLMHLRRDASRFPHATVKQHTSENKEKTVFSLFSVRIMGYLEFEKLNFISEMVKNYTITEACKALWRRQTNIKFPSSRKAKCRL